MDERFYSRTVVSGPAQPTPIHLFNLRVCKQQVFFEIFELLIIEVKLALEGTIRHSTLPLEQCSCLVHNFREFHRLPVSLSAFFWSAFSASGCALMEGRWSV